VLLYWLLEENWDLSIHDDHINDGRKKVLCGPDSPNRREADMAIQLRNTGCSLLFLMAAAVCSYAQQVEPAYTDSLKVKSASEAYDIALHYTGFEVSDSAVRDEIERSAALITIENDQTPFLREQVNGHPAWKLEFSGVRFLDEQIEHRLQQKPIRSFEVIIDAQTGLLLRIYSIRENYDKSISPMPSVDKAEDEMRRYGREKYHGFPANLPSATFLQALQHASGSPYLAGEIIAEYVVRSVMNNPPSNVWAIDLRGIPPFPTVSHQGIGIVPEYQRNHMRSIIDGKTGNFMSCNTGPQVERKPEDSL
jgi:hypothetical protein